MSEKLSKQDNKFIGEYVKQRNGVKAAKKAYGIKSYQYAGLKAHRLLKQEKIQKGVASALPDDLLARKHNELFDLKQVEYFSFPRTMNDEEIVEHVASAGIQVISIRITEKSKLAFYAMPDGQAIKSALDMAYKIKSTYAPEKKVSLNVEVEANPEIKELTNKLNEIYRGPSGGSDGGTPVSLGEETQDQE